MKPDWPNAGDGDWFKMSVPPGISDGWWAGLPFERKQFLEDLIGLVDDICDGEVLEVRFDGREFSHVLYSERDLEGQAAGKAAGRDPEQWWSEMRPGRKAFVQQVDRLLGRMTHEKALQFRRSGEAFNLVLGRRVTEGKPELN